MLNDELVAYSLVENASLLSMGLLPKSKKNEGSVACIKNANSSFTSAMLCFLHFNDGNEKNTKDQKQSRFRLLRKSRSSSNFNTQNSSNMVVPQRTHCRTQSAVSASVATPKNDALMANSASATSLQKSPAHLGIFTKVDKASLKLLSTSSPTMTNQTATPTTPKPTKENKLPTTSKSRQKKFQRHFPTVDGDEIVLNYYSCALIGDILLQGNLYITKNYFAFYSNVFGYVTKLLIPMLTVDNITKEKTARIIPNAVGISTGDEKHVFGSLMSRDNTYKFMLKVWEMSREESNIEPEILTNPEILEIAASDSDSSETKEMESEKESTAQFEINSTNRITNINSQFSTEQKKDHFNLRHKLLQGFKSVLKMPKQTLFLLAATFILLVLFLSASLLLFRISRIHDKYLSILEDHNLPIMSNDEIFNRILQFSNNLHSKSANSINNFIDSNLHEISRISENLETLSSILMPKDSSNDAKDSTQKNFNAS